jgi:hypothetical protein
MLALSSRVASAGAELEVLASIEADGGLAADGELTSSAQDLPDSVLMSGLLIRLARPPTAEAPSADMMSDVQR